MLGLKLNHVSKRGHRSFISKYIWKCRLGDVDYFFCCEIQMCLSASFIRCATRQCVSLIGPPTWGLVTGDCCDPVAVNDLTGIVMLISQKVNRSQQPGNITLSWRYISRAYSMFAPSLWGTALHYNVSHWLGASIKPALVLAKGSVGNTAFISQTDEHITCCLQNLVPLFLSRFYLNSALNE